MNPVHLIPTPEAIPAPAWMFVVLENALFLLHLILINIVVGGSLLAVASRSRGHPGSLAGMLDKKLPLFLPFAITLGIAPLLFMQVLYGHLFYSSSVLMAKYWIAVIPLLIIAYYGLYVYARRRDRTPGLARGSLALATVVFLYIGFMLVNNNCLMAQPDRWGPYFDRRDGTLLNLGDPTLLPRFGHFLLASIAVAALLTSLLAQQRAPPGDAMAARTVRTGLRIFGFSTLLQFAVGSWYVLAIPRPLARQFMGQNLAMSLTLLFGVLAGLGATVSALRGKLRPTVIQLAVALVAMIVTRDNLRTLYLKPYFSLDTLKLNPQYGVLALFLAVLVAGLIIVAYMVRLAFRGATKGGAQ